MEKKIIKKLAEELAKRDIKSLEEFLCGLKFEDACKILNGYNRDCLIINGNVEFESFDVNYKAITTTIYNDNGSCHLCGFCEVWLDEFSSPIEIIKIG